METPGAYDLKAYPICKICDRGTLMPRKIRRLSGPAVAIGYILLIPSILGMVGCAILLVVSLLAGAAGAAHRSAFATAFAGTWSIAMVSSGIGCFVFGLLGWLLIMKKHVLQCVYCGAVVNAVAPISSQPERSTLSARNVVLGALLILGITGAIWAFVVAEAGTQTSKPTAMTAEPAKPTQDNAPQTPQVTDNEATQTPDKAEEDKQLKLGADAMVATWQATPVAFNERENLRFDAVIVMPDNTVCLSIHDAHPFPGVEEPNALIYGGGRLYPVNDVTADLWARECVNQQGINMEPEIEDRFSQIQRQMDDLNQELHNSQPAQPGQPAPQQSAPPEPAPALSFQPSPESTDVTPAAVASRQETSGSPSQTTEVTQGQTPDQVVAILGPPISITTGTKHVYTYPHVMIVFTDGKVSEIHQIQ